MKTMISHLLLPVRAPCLIVHRHCICHNATHMKKINGCYMLDFVHTYWFEFDEYDYRAATIVTQGNVVALVMVFLIQFGRNRVW